MAMKKAGKKKRDEVVSTMLTPAERARLEEAARKEGLSSSAVIRRSLLRDRVIDADADWPESAGR